MFNREKYLNECINEKTKDELQNKERELQRWLARNGWTFAEPTAEALNRLSCIYEALARRLETAPAVTCKTCGFAGYEADDLVYCAGCNLPEDECICKLHD